MDHLRSGGADAGRRSCRWCPQTRAAMSDRSGVARDGQRREVLHGKERALCERLGIPWNLSILERWALGRASPHVEEPEFDGSPRRGRPKKQKAETFVERRLNFVDPVQREYRKATGKTLTDSEFVRRIKSRIALHPSPKPEVAELFQAAEKSLLSRLSEARKITKK